MIVGFFKFLWWLCFGGCLHKWNNWEDNNYGGKQYRRCYKCRLIASRSYSTL